MHQGPIPGTRLSSPTSLLATTCEKVAGAKVASRILVELADFIVDGESDGVADSGMADAILALESLGFKKEQIKKALVGATGDTSSLVKHGLKRLQRI